MKTEEEPAERRWEKAKGQTMSSGWPLPLRERLETGGRGGAEAFELCGWADSIQPSQVLTPMVGKDVRAGIEGQGTLDGDWTSEEDWVGWSEDLGLWSGSQKSWRQAKALFMVQVRQ